MLLSVQLGAASGAEDPALTVIGLTEGASLKVGTLTLAPPEGSPKITLPRQGLIQVLGGKVILSGGGARIEAEPGARFIAFVERGRINIQVIEGSLVLIRPGEKPRTLKAGETDSIGDSAKAVLKDYPAPETEPTPPPPPPPTPAPAPEVVSERVVEPPTAPLKPLSPKSLAALKIILHPRYTLEEAYHSNIYQAPDPGPGQPTVGGGVVDGWVTTNVLGLGVEIPLSHKHKLTAGYSFTALNHSRHPSANNALDQDVEAAYAFTGKKVRFSASDVYANNENPAFSESVVRERRWDNTAKAAVEAAQSRRLYWGLDFEHAAHKYLSPTVGALLNHYQQSFGGNVGVLVRPRTKVYGAYHREVMHFTAGRAANSKGDTFDLGIEGEIAPKLKGKIQAGYHLRRYDDSGALSSVVRTWRTQVDLTYKARRDTSLSLSAFRSLNPATFGANRHYESTGGLLKARYSRHKLTYEAAAALTIDKYPESVTTGGLTANRRDDGYSFKYLIGYKARKWLSVDASYLRLQKHSIFANQFNFKDNQTALALKLSF